MPPYVATLVEEYPMLLPKISGAQFFDLNAISEMIETMVADCKASDPLFQSGRLPAQECVFEIADTALWCRQDGDAITMGLIHEVILLAMREQLEMLNDRGIIPPEKYRVLAEKVDADKERYSTVRIGDEWDGSNVVAVGLSAALEIILQPGLLVATEGRLPRHQRRRLAKKCSLHKHIVYTFNPARSASALPGNDEPAFRKCLHYARGHWRQNPGARNAREINGKPCVWVNGHWRGDPALGVTTKSYKAGQGFLQGGAT